MIYKHIGNTNNRLRWKLPREINHVIEYTAVHVLFECEITIIG